MKETKQILDAREELEAALRSMDEANDAIQALNDESTDEDRAGLNEAFERAEAAAIEKQEQLERRIAIQRAREAIPPVGESTRVEVNEPDTYRRDNQTAVSFVKDVMNAHLGSSSARERLEKHNQMQFDKGEQRDVSTADPGAGTFVPPRYLADLWAEFPRASRPFANILPKYDLPPTGMTLTIPRHTTGTSVATQQTEADAPSETDADGTLLSVSVRTFAGQQDLSIQALERTDPGFDMVVLNDLVAAYDSYLDTQCLAGTGSNGQHLGIRAVSNVNTVSYADASPTSAELHPKLYDAIQQILAGRHQPASHIVAHPRRAAWMAANLGTSFPLYQLGTYNQAGGAQNDGFVLNVAGLPVVMDANIATTYGNPTNSDQDEIYVVRAADLYLAEGPLRIRTLDQNLGGTLQVRLQVFAYSAFISGRQPESIAVISGTGLAAPSF